MSLFKKSENIVVATVTLLKLLKVRVHPSTVAETLHNHPQYPSLLSISESLMEWKVPNSAYFIKPDEYDSHELSFPFIAHTRENSGEFFVVKAIENAEVHIIDGSKTKVMSEKEFRFKWQGILLHATPDASSGQKDYKKARFEAFLKKSRTPALILLFLSLLGIAGAHAALSAWEIALATIKLAGTGVASLLLIQSVDAANPFIQNLCSFGGKNDCNTILKSAAAKITPWLSWSEVGFFYFTGTLTLLLTVPFSLGLLAMLSLLALPYTFYSIIYQYRSKNWCVLCCAVQALLWLEALVMIGAYFSGVAFPLQLTAYNVALWLIALLWPIVVWSFFKPFILNSKQLMPVKRQLASFKFNTELFNKSLSSQPKFAVPDEIRPVLLGNPEAETTITMVSNPFCNPCAQAHKTLDELLAGNANINLKIVFSTKDQKDDPRTKVAQHIAALAQVADKSFLEKALNDWYNSTTKNYETWAEKYPVQLNEETMQVSKLQREWCGFAEITHTPTIFVNGYKLNSPYVLDDLKYLIE